MTDEEKIGLREQLKTMQQALLVPPDSYFENEPETVAEKERNREWRQWQRER